MQVATLLPASAFTVTPRYAPMLLGKRVKHKVLGITGRHSGLCRTERSVLWHKVDTNAGHCWWAESNVAFLGPIPMGDGPAAA